MISIPSITRQRTIRPMPATPSSSAGPAAGPSNTTPSPTTGPPPATSPLATTTPNGPTFSALAACLKRPDYQGAHGDEVRCDQANYPARVIRQLVSQHPLVVP